MAAEEAARALNVDFATGLSQGEAAARFARVGPNELAEGRRTHPVVQFLRQFTSPLVVVLIMAAAVSAALSDIKDAVVITTILLFNGILGFVQEWRADRAMAALRKLATPRVRVRREGRVMEVAATAVVPGDVAVLATGDLVPADGRVFRAMNLRIDEASLTGESVAVDKVLSARADPSLPVADRVNMVFRGTAVVYGRGEVLVTTTGMRTELGKIASALARTRPAATPLQRRLAQLGKWLAVGALTICAMIFGLGVLRGESIGAMFMTAVALAVAAIPEGLPAVVTIALALGARRMAAKRALIRTLPAVEGLGSVTIICSDKTGTLTKNEMTVTDILADGRHWQLGAEGFREEAAGAAAALPAAVGDLLVAGALCNDAEVVSGESGDRNEVAFIGDPTEGALVVAAARADLDPEALRSQRPRLDEKPFDSDIKRMATLHQVDGHFVVYAKGAPESLLSVCSRIWWDGEERALGEELRHEVLSGVEALARRGRRTLAIAKGDRGAGEAARESPLDQDLTLLGVVGLMDPPRPEARAAIEQCRSADIRTMMITGDHRLTAEAIADELGLLAEGGEVLEGRDLEALSQDELERRVEGVAVFARVSPQHKHRIVSALQARGHVVAMTGDGVNDGPALKQADIGIAMGLTGSDVAREASALVLADDNFATIVAAVREGRVIYANLRRFLRFMLTTNVAEVLTILVAMLLGWPVPLLALHILWMNLVTDGAPALALGVEPAEKDVMARSPRPPKESLFSGGMLWHVALMSAVMAAYVLAIMRFGADLDTQRTIAFTALAFAQVAHCTVVRSERRLIYRVGLFTNRPLVAAVAATVIAQLLVVYVPALQDVFKTVALSPLELALCCGAGVLTIAVVESEKLARGYLEERRRAAPTA